MNFIRIYKKNSRYLQVAVKENGADAILDDMDICFIVEKDGECIIRKTRNNGAELKEKGIIEIELTHEDTNIDEGFYRCELLLTDVEGKRYTVLQSRIQIIKSYAKEC